MHGHTNIKLSRVIVLEFDAGDESYLNITDKIQDLSGIFLELHPKIFVHLPFFGILVMDFLSGTAEASYEMMFMLN